LEVEYFGQKFILKQLAAISTPNSREILIQPWDKSYVEDIVRALEKRGKLGGSPVVDQSSIRVVTPPLSEEYRQELIRFISEKKDEAKKTIRRWRDEAWSEIQEYFRQGKIREDDKFKGKDKLQEIIDEFSEKIEQMVEKKKKELEG
jgi:ribosome recycling factor